MTLGLLQRGYPPQPRPSRSFIRFSERLVFLSLPVLSFVSSPLFPRSLPESRFFRLFIKRRRRNKIDNAVQSRASPYI